MSPHLHGPCCLLILSWEGQRCSKPAYLGWHRAARAPQLAGSCPHAASGRTPHAAGDEARLVAQAAPLHWHMDRQHLKDGQTEECSSSLVFFEKQLSRYPCLHLGFAAGSSSPPAASRSQHTPHFSPAQSKAGTRASGQVLPTAELLAPAPAGGPGSSLPPLHLGEKLLSEIQLRCPFRQTTVLSWVLK